MRVEGISVRNMDGHTRDDTIPVGVNGTCEEMGSQAELWFYSVKTLTRIENQVRQWEEPVL